MKIKALGKNCVKYVIFHNIDAENNSFGNTIIPGNIDAYNHNFGNIDADDWGSKGLAGSRTNHSLKRSPGICLLYDIARLNLILYVSV